MSDVSDARTLRLERLESRSLLAGGVFDFALSEGNIESDPLHRNSLADSSRPHEVARNVPQSARTEASPPRNEPSRQIRFIRPHEEFRNASPATPVDAPPTPQGLSQQNQSVRNAFTPAVNEGFAFVSVQVTPPATSPSIAPSPQTQPLSRQPGAIDGVIASLASETSTETNAESAHARPTDEVTTVDSAMSSRIVVTDTRNAQQRDAFSPVVSGNPPTADNGFIDLTPLESLEPLGSDASDREPWQLESRTTASLRHIAENADDDRSDLLDQVMQDWVNGPGGLIALDRVELPAIAFPLNAAMIDVGLESMVSVNRSLNQVADSVTPALSGRVLDAIMSSIQRVAASETQPVVETSQLRIPTATYPAIAVVATTIALSAHRKYKHPQLNLQFSGGK